VALWANAEDYPPSRLAGETAKPAAEQAHRRDVLAVGERRLERHFDLGQIGESVSQRLVFPGKTGGRQ
jgi:hypothetical protein